MKNQTNYNSKWREYYQRALQAEIFVGLSFVWQDVGSGLRLAVFRDLMSRGRGRSWEERWRRRLKRASCPRWRTSTMLLMLGADVAANIRKRQAPAQVQLTITRGVLVLVFDDALADKVAEPVRVAANPVSLLGYDLRPTTSWRQAPSSRCSSSWRRGGTWSSPAGWIQRWVGGAQAPPTVGNFMEPI